MHFSIDVYAYAVMSNHLHLVIRIRPDCAESFSEDEVIRRWSATYSVPRELDQRGDREALISKWRARLSSISWFMRALNEPLARIANKEDGCTGRFWEGRFKSQALLDPGAILRCMAYVDLNPVRAGLCKGIEDSLYTSARARLVGNDDWLAKLPAKEALSDLQLDLRDYLELLRLSGGRIQGGVQREPPARLAKLLEQSGLDEPSWLRSLMRQHRWHRMIGTRDTLIRYARMQGVATLRSAWAI